tara:strand:- start:329 stop:451 length:123 start_codon:yes stop_codon:yes gene_type:complete
MGIVIQYITGIVTLTSIRMEEPEEPEVHLVDLAEPAELVV